MRKVVLHVHWKEKLLTSPLAQKSNGGFLDFRFSVVYVLSSNFPMKRALNKAWQGIFSLVNQSKGWVADYVAFIDVWFEFFFSFFVKTLFSQRDFSKMWKSASLREKGIEFVVCSESCILTLILKLENRSKNKNKFKKYQNANLFYFVELFLLENHLRFTDIVALKLIVASFTWVHYTWHFISERLYWST